MAGIEALRTKLKLVEFNEKNHLSVEATAKKFDTPKSTVYYILSKKKLWLKRYNSVKNGRSKRFWLSENAVIDSELMQWYSNLKIANDFTGITKVDLRKKVKSVAREYKIDFKPTRDWIKQFVGKHEVVFRKIDSGVNKSRKVNQNSAKRAKIHISGAIFSTTPHESVQKNKRICKTNEKFKKSSSTTGAQKVAENDVVKNIESQTLKRRRIRSGSVKEFGKTNRTTPAKENATRDAQKCVKNLQKRIPRNNSRRSLKKSEKTHPTSPVRENVTRDAQKRVNNIHLQKCITRNRTNSGNPRQSVKKSEKTHPTSPAKENVRRDSHKRVNKIDLQKRITRNRTNSDNRRQSVNKIENATRDAQNLKKHITRRRIQSEGTRSISERARPPASATGNPKKVANKTRSENPKHSGDFEKTNAVSPVKENATGGVQKVELQITTNSEHCRQTISEANNNNNYSLVKPKSEPKPRNRFEFSKIKKRTKRIRPDDANIKRLTRGSRLKTLSVAAFENSTSRVTRNYLKLLEDRHEMLLPPTRRKRKPKLGDIVKAEPTAWSTDDAEEQLDATCKTRRRLKKLVVLDKPSEDPFDDSGTFEDETVNGADLDASQYYGAIENDGVVEIFCTKPPCEECTITPNRKPKIEIHSNIQIISGSKNLMKRQRSSVSGTASTTTESLIAEDNSEMSWSNLFPDLDKTLSEDELVHQINEIEFQYDPDPFKNVKIEVLPSAMTDEDEYDGAEGDDELEDDDVPSSQGQPMPPPNQMPQPPNGMQGGYRPPMAPRPSPPRGPQPTTRMPGGPRPPMNNRAPGMRPRAPMIRPRGAAVGQPVRSPMRPRMNGPQNMRPGNQVSPIKRDPGGAALQAKRRKVDVLTPSDKDDDDCQVICMQPKNTGLPQIESIQGASESVENSIMKLSDSITLSVRNPPPKPVVSPQKSDAKAVANVLASRGITVTASGKPKDSPTKQAPALPTALSLNGAVSIVAKNTANAKPTASDNLPTVDLTEDSPSTNTVNSPSKNRPGLPYRCDLCPAQYPNAMGLNKHRQTYHKTTSGMCELGVPLINIKQPGIMQKLSQIGINNYIPLPSAGPEGTYALPIISTKNPGNVAALGATQMLSLGPVRAIPRPGAPNNTVKK